MARKLTDFGNTAKMIEHEGRTQSLTQWSKELGIPVSTLNTRMTRLGLTFEEAIHYMPAPPKAKLDDPEELRRLQTEINIAIAYRIRRNMNQLFDWIDQTIGTDPQKVAKVVESFSSVYGSASKAAPAKPNKHAAAINISLNTHAKPQPQPKAIDYTEVIDAETTISITEHEIPEAGEQEEQG